MHEFRIGKKEVANRGGNWAVDIFGFCSDVIEKRSKCVNEQVGSLEKVPITKLHKKRFAEKKCLENRSSVKLTFSEKAM